jgi:choline monooxygenase
MTYHFDNRLAFASTIPSSYYTERDVLPREQRNVFATTWQFIGRAEQVREPGQFFTAGIAGEPLLIVRGNDGVLRALSNVCRHRAGPVARGEGRRPVLQCGYHGWTYSLDGRLAVTPEFEGVECFDRSSVALPQFRIEEWNGLLFVNLDPSAPSLSDFLGEMLHDMPGHDYSGFRLAARKEWEVGCNWKVYVDNYLEGYHVPMVHPALNREIDYKAYETVLASHRVLQHAPVRPESAQLYSQASGEPNASYYWLFPNIMLNLYEQQLQLNVVIPETIDRTVVRFEWFALDAGAEFALDPHFQALLELTEIVQAEDAGICEVVQGNLGSSAYRPGPYSPLRETGVHHFHRLMLAR